MLYLYLLPEELAAQEQLVVVVLPSVFQVRAHVQLVADLFSDPKGSSAGFGRDRINSL